MVNYFFEFTKTCFFKLFKHGHFLINYRFRLLGVELSIALGLLNFLQGKGKKISDWVMPLGFICMGKYSHNFFKKVLGLIEATGVFESPLFRNGQFKCFVHILRGPWSILNTYDLT